MGYQDFRKERDEKSGDLMGLGKLLHREVLVQTLTHDGQYELIAGTFDFFHPQTKQVYIKDFTIWFCKTNGEKKPMYSGEICMLVEKSIFAIMSKPEKLSKE
jgi:hypothetical protein